MPKLLWVAMPLLIAATLVALQWQLYSGGPTSLYGSVPQPRRVDLLLRFFL